MTSLGTLKFRMNFKCSKSSKQIKNLVCYLKEYILYVLENMF